MANDNQLRRLLRRALQFEKLEKNATSLEQQNEVLREIVGELEKRVGGKRIINYHKNKTTWTQD